MCFAVVTGIPVSFCFLNYRIGRLKNFYTGYGRFNDGKLHLSFTAHIAYGNFIVITEHKWFFVLVTVCFKAISIFLFVKIGFFNTSILKMYTNSDIFEIKVKAIIAEKFFSFACFIVITCIPVSMCILYYRFRRSDNL